MSKNNPKLQPAKTTVYGPRLDPKAIPASWAPTRELGQPKQIEMKDPVAENLPRLKLVLHAVKDLAKSGCTIEVKFPNAVPFRSSVAKNKTGPFPNEEYVFCLEPCSQPFTCLISAVIKKSGLVGGSKKELFGAVAIDVFRDLGLRYAGDTRRHNYPLSPKGEVSITFTALTDVQFPRMQLKNIDGMASTVSLPMKQVPEITLTLYQLIQLNGEKVLQTRCEVIHKTYNMRTLPGVNPELKSSVMTTQIIKGYSPYWGASCKIPIACKADLIKVKMDYQLGKKKKNVKEVICTIAVDEIAKMATATESRRWFAFPLDSHWKGGCIGIGITALTNMAADEITS